MTGAICKCDDAVITRFMHPVEIAWNNIFWFKNDKMLSEWWGKESLVRKQVKLNPSGIIDTCRDIVALFTNKLLLFAVLCDIPRECDVAVDIGIWGRGKKSGDVLTDPDNGAVFGSDRKFLIRIFPTLTEVILIIIFYLLLIIFMNDHKRRFAYQFLFVVPQFFEANVIQKNKICTYVAAVDEIFGILNQQLVCVFQFHFFGNVLSEDNLNISWKNLVRPLNPFNLIFFTEHRNEVISSILKIL